MNNPSAPPEPPYTDAGGPRTSAGAALVAAGGMFGTAFRYLVTRAISATGGIDVGILAVNVTGAALLGFLVGFLAVRGTGQFHAVRLMVGTGLLGGYTTYSALAVGTAELALDSRIQVGVAYALVTIALGVVATLTGMGLGRASGQRR